MWVANEGQATILIHLCSISFRSLYHQVIFGRLEEDKYVPKKERFLQQVETIWALSLVDLCRHSRNNVLVSLLAHPNPWNIEQSETS